jgi:hypothetical protein
MMWILLWCWNSITNTIAFKECLSLSSKMFQSCIVFQIFQRVSTHPSHATLNRDDICHLRIWLSMRCNGRAIVHLPPPGYQLCVITSNTIETTFIRSINIFLVLFKVHSLYGGMLSNERWTVINEQWVIRCNIWAVREQKYMELHPLNLYPWWFDIRQSKHLLQWQHCCCCSCSSPSPSYCHRHHALF